MSGRCEGSRYHRRREMTEQTGTDSYVLGSRKSAHHRYRLFNDVFLPGTLQRLPALHLSPDMHILEIGSGIGDTACYLAKNIVPDGHVTGFDQAPDLVELAQRQAKDAGIDNVSFHCATAQDFPFPENEFDLAHTRYVLTYLSDADDILRKAYRALKPSGIFFGEEMAQIYIKHGRADWFDQMADWFSQLIEIGGGNPNYGIDQMPSDVLNAGFKDLVVTAFWPFEDQQKVVDMVRIAVSEEMRPNILKHGIATAEQVDALVSELAVEERDYAISPSIAAQVTARKAG